MAKSGLKHIDVGPELTKTEWESEDSHQLVHGTSFPSSPVERQLFYRDDEHKWYIYNASAWVWLGGGSGGGMQIHGNEYHDPDFEQQGVAASLIETHQTTAIHTQPQVPQEHGNETHSLDFATESALSSHVNLTNPHSATAAATPDRLMLRDASGRVQVAAPSAAGDVARKSEVDAKPDLGETSTTAYRGDRGKTAYDHSQAATGAEHGAVSAATPNMIIRRDANARAKVAAPSASDDIALKSTVDDIKNKDTKIIDADADTQIQVEESADEDKIRMDVKGVEAFLLHDSGILDLVKQSGAHVTRITTVQSIPSLTYTKVQFNGEDYDIQGEFDNATNYRFTATKAGKYLVTYGLELLAVADGKLVKGYIAKNGSVVFNTGAHTGYAGNINVSGADIITLAPNDYIEIYVYHSDTVARDLNKDYSAACFYKIV